MANTQSSGSGQSGEFDFWGWLVIIICLSAFPPLGLFLLFKKLMGLTGRQKKQKQQERHPYDLQREGQEKAAPGTQGVGREKDRRSGRRVPQMGKVNLSRGKGMTVAGGIAAGVFGLVSVSALLKALSWGGFFYSLQEIFIPLVLCCASLVVLYAGVQRTKKAKRFRKYLSLIGAHTEISVDALARAMPVSASAACEDLQDMLDDGILPTGYIDMNTGRLILSDKGLKEEPAAPAPEPAAPTGDDAVLTEIKSVNDAIADPVMSAKIDRIGEITGKIFAYQRKNPGKDSQLNSFLSYYLPTTLRILKAYAQMEEQGVEGENIHAAKARIEGMMDKVVEGFEKQLDRLFQDDAMDITTDVEVLERMLEKDGLSGGGLQLPS